MTSDIFFSWKVSLRSTRHDLLNGLYGAFCNRRVTGITNHSLRAIFLRDESPLVPVVAVTYGKSGYVATKGAMLLHDQAVDIDGLVVVHLNPNRP